MPRALPRREPWATPRAPFTPPRSRNRSPAGRRPCTTRGFQASYARARHAARDDCLPPLLTPVDPRRSVADAERAGAGRAADASAAYMVLQGSVCLRRRRGLWAPGPVLRGLGSGVWASGLPGFRASGLMGSGLRALGPCTRPGGRASGCCPAPVPSFRANGTSGQGSAANARVRARRRPRTRTTRGRIPRISPPLAAPPPRNPPGPGRHRDWAPMPSWMPRYGAAISAGLSAGRAASFFSSPCMVPRGRNADAIPPSSSLSMPGARCHQRADHPRGFQNVSGFCMRRSSRSAPLPFPPSVHASEHPTYVLLRAETETAPPPAPPRPFAVHHTMTNFTPFSTPRSLDT